MPLPVTCVGPTQQRSYRFACYNFYNTGHFLYSRLHSLISTFFLTQVVSQPTHLGTHGGSLIDLVLLSQPSQLLKCATIPPLGNSDHQGISVKLKWRVSSKQLTSNQRTVWRYKYADFRGACSLYLTSSTGIRYCPRT